VLTLVGSVDPGVPGRYPTCPFLFATGLLCPGCGTLRALYALVHLDVVQAVSANVLTVLAVPLLAWMWWRWAGQLWAGRSRQQLAPPWRIQALLVVILAFWVLRNVPAASFLAP